MANNTYDMPDLQLRMSKKIAQLTNVIHHLHTKTEDHEMDLQEMAGAYEAEIDNMLKDAATRINTFKNQLEAARDDTRFQEAVQKVKGEYDQLRQAAVTELAAFKQKTSAREAAVQIAAKKQLDEMEQQLQALVKRLDSAVNDLETVRHQADEQHSKLTVQLEKATEETEEAIKEGNHRYNAMLNERMNKEDQLRRSMEKIKLEVASKDSSVKALQDDIAKQQKDVAIAQARQQKAWDEERRAAAVQQEEAERKWQDQLQASVSRTEEQRQQTLAANRKIGAVEGALAAAKEKHTAQASRTAELERQVSALETELGQVKSTKDSLAGTAAQEQERVVALQTEVAGLKATHVAAVAKLNEEKGGLQTQIVELTSQLDTVQQQVKDLSDSQRRAAQDHMKAQATVQSMQSELHDLRLVFADLKALREQEQKKAASELAEANVAHAAALRGKAAEVAAVREQLAKERQERTDAMQQGQKSVADVRAQMLLEAKQKVDDAKQAHQDELHELQARFDVAAKATFASHKEQIEALQMRHEAAVMQAREAHAADLDARLAELTDSGAKELAQQQGVWAAQEQAFTTEAQSLKQQLKSLQAEYKQLRDQNSRSAVKSEGDQQVLQQKLSELRGQLVASEAKLGAASKLQEQAQEGLIRAEADAIQAAAAAAEEAAALQQSIRDLEAKHKRDKHEADTRLQIELDQLRAELTAQWEQKMADSVADSLSNATRFHKDQLDSHQQKLTAALEQQHAAEVKSVRARHAEELAALQSNLERQHEEVVSALSGDWQIKLDRASSEASSSLRSAQSAALEELATEKQAHAAELAERTARHEEQVQKMLQQHARDVAEARAGHEAAFKALKEDLDRIVWEKDKSLAEHKQQSSKELKSVQVASETAAKEAQTLQGRLQSQFKQLEAKVASAETENQQLSHRVTELQGALVQKSASMTDALHAMRESHGDAMASAGQRFSDTIAAKDEAHSRSISALQATLEDVRAEAEEKYDSLAQAYTELSAQWETRGPREEDVERIRMLMATLEDRDAQIAAFEERYNELHNEMLLREDNYNNRFANGGAGRHKLAVDKAMSSTQDVSAWMLKRSSKVGAVNRTGSMGPRSSFKVSSARGSPCKTDPDRTGPV
eukprot:jgi/Ulvmu1/9838/UM056_0079.1